MPPTAARADATAFFGGTFRQDVDRMLDRVAAVGTPEDVARRLDAFVDAGAHHVVVAPSTPGDATQMAHRIAADVIPLVRSNLSVTG